jgi:AraC-like DNA-binding protein/mannose-6-phosphate isomerase-like protein (cupin superfamily)
MKLKYKTIHTKTKKALMVERINQRHFEQNWHYHEEHELIYYVKGKGTRVVGDNLSEFKERDLVLVGAGLPHLWKNSEDVEKEGLDVIVIKFDTKHSVFSLLSTPEFGQINRLFHLSQCGVKFSVKAAKQIHELILAMISSEPAMQIILFLQVIQILSKSLDMELLASPEFSLPKTNSEEQRLHRIIDFLSNNYTNQLTLEDISNAAAMTPNSLCRFFKTRTNKTIFKYLNEFRVGKACELLINGEHSITEVCFETGFNSLTSFNRVFKEVKSVTPRDFKRKYQVLNAGIGFQAFSA